VFTHHSPESHQVRDHRIHQKEMRHRKAVAGKWSAEPTHRLADQYNVVRADAGRNDGLGLVGEGCARPTR
jgi:hypothetical protein